MTYPFLDPSDAPWTPEYQDSAVAARKEQLRKIQELRQLDEDHEHQLLHK